MSGNEKEDTTAAAEARQRQVKDTKSAHKPSGGRWVPGKNLPNQLTILRVFMIPLFVVFLMAVPGKAGDITSAVIFIAASLTDTADGYIARKYN